LGAARRRAARSEKGKLSGGLALKPAPRGTWCSPRQRGRSTRRLLEHATEVAHRVHPPRSINTQPVEDGSQTGAGQRDAPTAFVRRPCRSRRGRATTDGNRMVGVWLPRLTATGWWVSGFPLNLRVRAGGCVSSTTEFANKLPILNRCRRLAPGVHFANFGFTSLVPTFTTIPVNSPTFTFVPL
jgi:hypothetical protein